MKEKRSFKTILLLVSPLLLFFLLFLPYAKINGAFLVDWLGCGCPVFDADWNEIDTFNANDFTRCFFLFVSACATVISVPLSKKIFHKKKLLRVGYIAGIAITSLLITAWFSKALMWC